MKGIMLRFRDKEHLLGESFLANNRFDPVLGFLSHFM
jgi:hypothetical protein